MYIQIYRNNLLLVEVQPSTSSVLSQKKQQEDIIRLDFILEKYVELKIGDYITFEKTKQFYRLNSEPQVIESPKNNQYECIFEGGLHELKKTKIFLTTGAYKDYKFSLTGNAQTLLTFIVSNLNRNSSGYVVGRYKETATQTIEFNNWDAFEAVNELSTALGFSWYLDGKVLHFDEKQTNSSYVFQVGMLAGFTQLSRLRIEQALCTVLYGYGSTENLPPRTASTGATYDSPLLTENRLAFNGVEGGSKLENNVSLYGRIESVKEYDEIKPERVGTVTDITDNVRIIIDEGIDFDIEQQKIAGITPKLNFLSGDLVGLTFEISFDYLWKRITLDTLTETSGTYPNELLHAKVGDQYILVDIIMPDTYINEAKTRLQEAVQAELNTISKPLALYEGQLDKFFIESNKLALDIGMVVRMISSAFKIDNLYEIKELTQSITDPSDYKIKFGDILPKGLLALLKSINFSTQQQIYSIQKNSYTTNEIINQVTTIVGDSLVWEELI